MDRFQNKYRIPSARANWWNYGWVGAYFITICTKDREKYFGEIKDGKIYLSHAGILPDVFWNEIPKHGIDLELGAFVVMPNHIHGILILNTDNDQLGLGNVVDTNIGGTNIGNNIGDIGNIGNIVETRHALSLRDNNTNRDNTNRDNNPKTDFKILAKIRFRLLLVVTNLW